MNAHQEFSQFLHKLGKKTGQVAVCEAALMGFRQIDSESTDYVPVYATKPESPDKRPYAVIGLPEEAINEINNILPDAINQFNQEYSYSGEGLRVSKHTTGESSSWDGRDFGTYDPGYSETSYEIDGDVEEYVNSVMKSWVANASDIFSAETPESLAPKTEQIKSIMHNYLENVEIYEN